MEKHTSLTAYLASAGTFVFGGLTLQDFAMLVGIITAVATFAVNWYYKAKQDTREDHLLVFRNEPKE